MDDYLNSLKIYQRNGKLGKAMEAQVKAKEEEIKKKAEEVTNKAFASKEEAINAFRNYFEL